MRQAQCASDSKKSARRLALAPLTAAIALCAVHAGHASTIAVNDASAASMPGKCTLPDAVTALNTASIVHGCGAGNGNDDTISLAFFQSATTISFSAPMSANGKSALQLDKAATISGSLDSDGKPLVTITRSTAVGVPKFRIIDATATLTLKGIAVTGGDSDDHGAGVASTTARFSALTLIDSVVSGNASSVSGGGVSVDCVNFFAINSTISNNTSQINGGGIYSSSNGVYYPCYNTLILSRSTVSTNTASGNGGGIFAFAGINHVLGSTFTANRARYGGALYTYGYAGLTNSTLTGNHADVSGAAVDVIVGNTYLVSATIAANSADGVNGVGGIITTALHTVGSIVTGNGTSNVAVQKSPVNTANYQIYGSNNILGAAPAPNFATATLDCDPQLGSLADNGGPTQTMRPGAGSCAIDAGPTVAPDDGQQAGARLLTDQRGARFLRTFGAATDIGALETQPNERIFFDGFDTYYINGIGNLPTIAANAH
jgi:hypothetical protein